MSTFLAQPVWEYYSKVNTDFSQSYHTTSTLKSTELTNGQANHPSDLLVPAKRSGIVSLRPFVNRKPWIHYEGISNPIHFDQRLTPCGYPSNSDLLHLNDYSTL